MREDLRIPPDARRPNHFTQSSILRTVSTMTAKASGRQKPGSRLVCGEQKESFSIASSIGNALSVSKREKGFSKAVSEAVSWTADRVKSQNPPFLKN